MKRLSLPLAIVASLSLALMAGAAANNGTGKLKVESPGVGLELKVAGRPAPVPNGKEVPMPPGTYPTSSITYGAQGKAANGKAEVWTIKSTGPFGTLKDINVTAGQTTTVEAGGPLAVKANVFPVKGKDGAISVSVSLRVTGKAGEVYNTGSIMKGLIKAPAPQIQILSEDGKTLAQGNFEYG